MKLHHLTDAAPPDLGRALAEFEREFTYPLGSDQRFRISHGEAYLPFFRAIGDPEVLVAEHRGVVLGTLSRVRRRLEWRTRPDSPPVIPEAHYLCDLKVSAAARGSTVLARLIRETKRAIVASGHHACYCVVMEGTGRLPTDYTGRLGVPVFEKLGEIVVLRISPGPDGVKAKSGATVTGGHLTRSGHFASGGDSSLRSILDPQMIATGDGLARGILEDTRRGKRLFLVPGGELRSAHLSGFAYAAPQAGAALLTSALERAVAAGFPAVFTAVPAGEWPRLRPFMEGTRVQVAPAAVYGHGLHAGGDWWIDTAEI